MKITSRSALRSLKSAVAAAALTLMAQPVLASHIFFQDVAINGVALNSAQGFTDPTFNVVVGDVLKLTFNTTAPDTFDIHADNIGAGSFQTSQFLSTGSQSFDLIFNTVGMFSNANIYINSRASTPDYNQFSNCFNGCTFGFNVNVASTTPVPGPIAGAGLPALMALGGFVWARQRKAAAA